MKAFGLFDQIDGAQSYRTGQIIFAEGDPGQELFVILEGAVAISVEGKPIDQLEAGDIFGEMALVDDQPRSASASAASDCKVLPVDRRHFLELVGRSPEFAIQVMSTMSERLRRFLDEEVRRQRLEEELAIGHQVQLSLLPNALPDIPGWDFAAFYQPVGEVGGDFYDFISLADDLGCLGIVIADVTGDGIPAALFMASCRTAIRAEAMRGLSPAETLRQANRLITMDVCNPLFLGVFYATLETVSGRLVFANGGHEWPLHLRGQDGQVEPLRARGLLLGAFADLDFQERELVVAPGDVIVFFTDGLSETRDDRDRFFGTKHLIELIRANADQDAHAIAQAIIAGVERFRGARYPGDDLTLIVIRRNS